MALRDDDDILRRLGKKGIDAIGKIASPISEISSSATGALGGAVVGGGLILGPPRRSSCRRINFGPPRVDYWRFNGLQL
jgi:hypothetical protein